MKQDRRIPVLQSEMDLVFLHLYDANFGVIAKHPYRNNLIMIMPDKKFIPEFGKSYKCAVTNTQTGTFVFNKRTYELAIAHRLDEGTIIDVVDYKYGDPFASTPKEPTKFTNNPFTVLAGLKVKGGRK